MFNLDKCKKFKHHLLPYESKSGLPVEEIEDGIFVSSFFFSFLDIYHPEPPIFAHQYKKKFIFLDLTNKPLKLSGDKIDYKFVEAITKNIPVLTERNGITEKYLGKDYPLYLEYNNLIYISKDLIFDTYIYLKRKIDKSKFDGRYFAADLANKVRKILNED